MNVIAASFDVKSGRYLTPSWMNVGHFGAFVFGRVIPSASRGSISDRALIANNGKLIASNPVGIALGHGAVKTSIGWKRNYEGVLYSTRPLGPDDVSADSYGRDAVTALGPEVNPPIIRSWISRKFLRVFFDLG
jgi:hypothetical protein